MKITGQCHILSTDFFNRDAQVVACALLGKIIRHRVGDLWLAACIIETESYYLDGKGSHASLGFTEKRRALFAPPGTISFTCITRAAGIH